MVKSLLGLVFGIFISQFAFAQEVEMNTLIKRLKEPIYGRNCGFAGVDPEDRTRIERLIQFKDTLAIFPWLYDEDPALQTYGVEAVIRLEKGGMVMPLRIRKLVAELRKSATMVNICMGCNFDALPMHLALEGSAP